MKVTAANLEARVTNLNNWLMANPQHEDYKKKSQRRNYYVGKLTEMDDYQLETIEI